MIKAPKPKQCPICSTVYFPRNSLQKVCHYIPCAMEYSRNKTNEKNLKQAKRASRARLIKYREDNKPLQKLKAEAQTVFNKYIRLRDYGLPCISCGKDMEWQSQSVKGSGIDAGHYKSRGAHPELAFNVFNVAAQCVTCNRHKSGNVNNFRNGLIEKFGLSVVERLESYSGTSQRDREYLQRIKTVFTKRVKHMEKLNKNKAG